MWKGIRELVDLPTILHPQIAVMINQIKMVEFLYKLLI